jgi:hypothetical protein
LGVSEFIGFTIEHELLVQRSTSLLFLEEPFSNMEVDTVVRSLPNYKSPSLDGFNNEFTKASWEVIK